MKKVHNQLVYDKCYAIYDIANSKYLTPLNKWENQLRKVKLYTSRTWAEEKLSDKQVQFKDKKQLVIVEVEIKVTM